MWERNQFLFLICKEKNDHSTLLCYHPAAVQDALKSGAVYIRKCKLDNDDAHMYIFRKTTEKSVLFQAVLYFPSCIIVFNVWVTHLSQKLHIKQHKSNVEERCKTIQEVELQIKISVVIIQAEIHGLRKKTQGIIIPRRYKLSVILHFIITFKTTLEKIILILLILLRFSLNYLNAFLKHNIQWVIHVNYEMWTL